MSEKRNFAIPLIAEGLLTLRVLINGEQVTGQKAINKH